MAISKAEILSKKDLKTESVFVEEWGCSVYVREFTGKQREAIASKGDEYRKSDRFMAWFVSQVAVDESGALIFDESDIDALADKSGNALHTVLNAGLKINGMGDAVISDLEKNSETTQSESSGSD